MAVSPETSSPNRKVGARILRRLLSTMTVSVETSSENGDVEIVALIFGTSKLAVSPETSSTNRKVGARILRSILLKMSVSPETSSENGDVEIVALIFGTSKMAVSPETSSKKLDVERAVLRHLFGALLDGLQDAPRSEIIEKQIVFQHFGSKVTVSLETSP